ncbi:MAG: N-acyl homoserine lactonase family protein [Peptococcaceae bacterium]
MEQIKIHVLQTGAVCVAPELPFGGERCSFVKASGIFSKPSSRLWLPVFVYWIEHPRGNILVDCGWHRDMSPHGVMDCKAQIRSLGSPLLYLVNQGRLPKGAAVNEQLEQCGLQERELDYVILTHLDCDHVNGLQLVQHARNILVAPEELRAATGRGTVRYQKRWWKGIKMQPFCWNGVEGPVGHSCDLFGDGSIRLVHIPGHAAGLTAVKIVNREGYYVLLCSDGAYGACSWQQMTVSGIAVDRMMQKRSLQWIKAQHDDEKCIAVLASHDADIKPQVIWL